MSKKIERKRKWFITYYGGRLPVHDFGYFKESFNKIIQQAKEEGLGKQERPVKLRLLGILGYLRLIKKNKGLMNGDVWLREPNNPFDKSPVTIIDVKDGYVLYKYSTGGTSTEKIRDFKRLYTKE